MSQNEVRPSGAIHQDERVDPHHHWRHEFQEWGRVNTRLERAPGSAGPAWYYFLALSLVTATLMWPMAVEFATGTPVGLETRARLTGLMVAVAVGAAGLRILWSALRSKPKVTRLWIPIGLGCLIWAAGAVAAVSAGLSPVGGPGLGAVPVGLHLTGMVMILAGTASLPGSIPLSRSGLLDLATVLLAVMAVLWSTTLPLYANPGSSTLSRVVIATLGSVCVMAGASIVVRTMLARHVELRGLVWALMLGGAAMVIVAPRAPEAIYTPASRTADALWTAMGAALFASGVRMQRSGKTTEVSLRQIERVQAFLPGAATIVGIIAVATHEGVLGNRDPIMAALGVGLLTVSSFRAAVMHAHNVEIFTRLQGSALDLAKVGREDSLTGLGNRLALEERLEVALSTASPDGVSVFFIDIDNFKEVNDSLGHEAGDTLLKILAERLTDVLGGEVYRVGGDEFVAVREDLDVTRAQTVAEAAVAALSPPVQIGLHRVSSGTSVGVARSSLRTDGNRGPDDAQLLMRRADLALYRAKELGRSQWAGYEPWLQDRADQRLTLQQNLRRSIDERELGLQFQPIIDLETNTVVGAEALVRWSTNDYGMLLPADFIPLFAEAGLMPQLGTLVFEEALAALGKTARFEGFIAVNLSREESTMPTVLTSMLSALKASNTEPSRLRLELTERNVLDPAARRLIQQATASGIGVCIEDFGTGPTSLRHLADFDNLTLKMDRSFLGPFGRKHDDQVILRAVSELADGLGFTVAAEAVASARQTQVLVDLGVKQAQGWYFGLPGDLGLIDARSSGGLHGASTGGSP